MGFLDSYRDSDSSYRKESRRRDMQEIGPKTSSPMDSHGRNYGVWWKWYCLLLYILRNKSDDTITSTCSGIFSSTLECFPQNAVKPFVYDLYFALVTMLQQYEAPVILLKERLFLFWLWSELNKNRVFSEAAICVEA